MCIYWLRNSKCVVAIGEREFHEADFLINVTNERTLTDSIILLVDAFKELLITI